MVKHKLVILNSDQFGYNAATYYYCKYFRGKFEIIYIGWDHGQEKVSLSGITIKYVSRDGGLLRIIRIIKKVLFCTKSTDTIILTEPFLIISAVSRLLRLRNPVILDIRTASVHTNRFKRYLLNSYLMIETLLYRHITVISHSLAQKLRLTKKSTIVPLGADILSDTEKIFNRIKLLYVGTLSNRKIENCVIGFSKFYHSYSWKHTPHFTIIGGGWNNEIEQLKKLVHACDMEFVIHILGVIPHDQLTPYFDSHNIGVSYVPTTDYFDVQPVTKTFEYLLSGMAVLGTGTYENKLVINHNNGIIINDTPDDFYYGLRKIYSQKHIFQSENIRQTSKQYSWKRIVKNFEIYLLSIASIK